MDLKSEANSDAFSYSKVANVQSDSTIGEPICIGPIGVTPIRSLSRASILDFVSRTAGWLAGVV